ncbi:conjugal transfer protein TrbL family protein [Actinoplanes sp. NPDC049316]|uniref:conjugal transfer protein TrbL family protein n=1 Tax=Actinoplanes sp. NPDC049316 TaxID=3154727 RepID=UPI003420D43C
MGWVTGELIETIVKWCAEMIVGGLNILWNLLAATVFVSPDVTVLPQVQAVSSTSLAIVNTVYVLAILWMAILVMGRDTIQSRYGPGELIPRLVIGLIGANLAMPLCAQLIGLANALTSALTSQDITSPNSMQQMRTVVTGSLANQTGNDPGGFLLILLGLVIAILVGMLVVQWIIRLGLLIVAVGVAPIALALHGTPQTEPAAKLWWRTMLGTLGTVVIQAVALHTTLTVFLSPQANLPALGLPGDPDVVMNLLIVLCLLWAILKVPSMMRRYVTKSSPSQAGMILRVVLIQQLTRGLSRAFGGSRVASGAGAARRGAGGPGVRGGGDPPWPTTTPRGGGSRPIPRSTSAVPAARSAPTAPRVPSRPPTGAGPGVVGTAYPTGRPVKPYTADEIAEGVDVYTRRLKSRGSTPATGRNRP